MTVIIEKSKIILSGCWIVILFNYLYGDLAMMMFHADMYSKITSKMSGIMVLASAVFIEISILMIILSLVLETGRNRLANIVTGVIFAAFPIVTLFMGGSPPPFYIFLSLIEFVFAVFIVYYAWKWK